MKNKAFTLIELLAVIVILAIIALIATPIILGIIKDARENAKKRSAELVYTGVEYAYTQSLFKEGSENVVDDVTLETIDKYLNVDNVASHGFDSSDTAKEELQIQTKDNVYCKVTKNTSKNVFEVSCGMSDEYDDEEVMGVKTIAYDVKPSQVYKPQYYTTAALSTGTVGGTAPADPSSATEPPTGYKSYIGYDIGTDGKVSAAYSCFIRNEKEYCLKGYDTTAYETNKEIIRDAFADVVDTKCTFDMNYGTYDRSYCNDSVSVSSDSFGSVYATADSWDCGVYSSGSISCGISF